jgi:hypothetical protein
MVLLSGAAVLRDAIVNRCRGSVRSEQQALSRFRLLVSLLPWRLYVTFQKLLDLQAVGG